MKTLLLLLICSLQIFAAEYQSKVLATLEVNRDTTSKEKYQSKVLATLEDTDKKKAATELAYKRTRVIAAQIKAIKETKAIEERRKLRAECATVYQNTIDMKIGNLTVREWQWVQTCQAVGAYPPWPR